MRAMRKWLTIGVVGLALRASASDAVEPASCTVTNWRSEGISAVSSLNYYEGSTLRFTNCVVYATGSDTNGTIQGLTDVDVDVTIGTSSTSVTYQASVTHAAAGKWACDVLVPSWTGQLFLQVKLTDVYTNSYIYPWKNISRQEPL